MNQVTLVTAFFDIQRETKGDGRSYKDYMSWMKETLKLNVPMVIYCAQDTYDNIKDVRINYPTKFIIKPDITHISFYKYLDRMKEIHNSIEYKLNVKNPERLECYLAEYVIINHGKLDYLLHAAENNYFDSKFFMWFDAGGSRFFHPSHDLSKPWPVNINKLHPEKFNCQMMKQSPELIKNNSIDKLMYESFPLVTGTLLGGTKDVIIKIFILSIKYFEYMLEKNCVALEQTTFGLIYKEKPDLINPFLNVTPHHLPYLHYLSS